MMTILVLIGCLAIVGLVVAARFRKSFPDLKDIGLMEYEE